jgi:hypothetical protein
MAYLRKGSSTITSSEVVDLTVADDLTVTDDLTVNGDISTSTASKIKDKGSCFQSALNRSLAFGY